MKDPIAQERKKEERKAAAFSLLGAIVGIVFYSFIVLLCWNFLAKELPIKSGDHFIFLPSLEFKHSLVLYVLCKVLFGRIRDSQKKKLDPNDDMNKKAIALEILKRKTFN